MVLPRFLCDPLLEFCQTSTRHGCLQFCFWIALVTMVKNQTILVGAFVSQKKREKYLAVVKKDIRRDLRKGSTRN